jgi:hypothetical protein
MNRKNREPSASGFFLLLLFLGAVSFLAVTNILLQKTGETLNHYFLR